VQDFLQAGLSSCFALTLEVDSVSVAALKEAHRPMTMKATNYLWVVEECITVVGTAAGT